MKRLLYAILALVCICLFVACKEEENGLVFKTLTFEEETTHFALPNETEEFSFLDEIETKGKTKYAVALDRYGMQTVLTKTVSLAVGDNTFYVVELLNEEAQKVYTVTIRRKPIYTVSFVNHYSEERVPTQKVEEGELVTEPSFFPQCIGDIFEGWDYDFNSPVMQNTKIKAKWEIEESFADFNFTSSANYCVITSLKDRDKSEVVIPQGVTEIGSAAFYNYSGLKSVKIPSGVTSVREHAFNYCQDLTSIVMPSSVKEIGVHAFNQCRSLTTVYYEGTPSEWERISVGAPNWALTYVTCYYYSENAPVEGGNYWHYGENGEIVVWESVSE